MVKSFFVMTAFADCPPPKRVSKAVFEKTLNCFLNVTHHKESFLDSII